MTSYFLRVAVLVLASYTAVVLLLFAVAFVRCTLRVRQARASAAARPAVQNVLVTYLAGASETGDLRAFAAKNSRTLEESILAFEPTIRGEGRDRLWGLALELGLVHRWCRHAESGDAPSRRTAYSWLAVVATYRPAFRLAEEVLLRGLESRDQETRREAARGLARSGNPGHAARVFRFCVSDSLLIRILLTQDLRPHAFPLCGKVVPEILRSGDPERVLAALEVLSAWERGLPLEDLGPAVENHSIRVRVQAMRLAPRLTPSLRVTECILLALGDQEEEVRAAAASAAGQLKLEAALPALARAVRLSSAESAAAADALAAMPPGGWQTLEELSASENATVAFLASGALERARMAVTP